MADIHLTTDSPENQRIIDRLVKREVHYCVSSWVEDCIKASYDGSEHLADWSSDYEDAISGCGQIELDLPSGARFYGTSAERDERAEELDDLAAVEKDDDKRAKIEDDAQALRDAEPEDVEVYEWWLVSSWAANRLKELGEVVLESAYGDHIWGRQCTGQAIFLDSSWAKMALEMEILKGQPNEWKDS